MISLIVLIFVAGLIRCTTPGQSEDQQADSTDFVVFSIMFLLVWVVALIGWLRNKDRKIKDFFTGLLILFNISIYSLFVPFIEPIHPSWLQLPIAAIGFWLWVFICFGFWVWLEHKIDPQREAREQAERVAFWRRIETEHLRQVEWDRQNDADMAKIAEMDAELDAIDAAIALERQAESLKRDGQKEGTEGVAADELGIYPTEAEIKAIRDEVRAHPVYQEAAGLKTGLVEDGITRLEELSRVDLYAELILLKWRMAEGGASADAINEAIDQWAEYHGIDDVTVEQQKLRQRGPSLKAIGEMPEGPAKEAALDEYATYKLQQELRDDAEKAMADVLEQYRIQAEKASKKITD